MEWVWTVGGVLCVLFVLVSLRDGGWKLYLPVFAWFAVSFTLAFKLPSPALTIVGLVVAFGVAGYIRPASRSERSAAHGSLKAQSAGAMGGSGSTATALDEDRAALACRQRC